MPEPLLIGWEAIHKLFCDAEGNAAIGLSTLQHKPYKDEMFAVAAIFKMRIGKCKTPRVCGWPSRILNWWTREQQKKWEEKNNNII